MLPFVCDVLESRESLGCEALRCAEFSTVLAGRPRRFLTSVKGNVMASRMICRSALLDDSRLDMDLVERRG
jgi:hypothetical protein